MTFTIITATWNSAETVAKTVQSVMAQGMANVEHLIIDNESTDGTLDAIAACRSPHVKVICGKDTGIYHAFNKGLTKASGEIVSFLNSDDHYLDGTLAAVEAAFQGHRDAGCIHGNIIVNGREFRPRHGLLSFGGARIYHPACFMRRAILRESGGFDESFRIVADLDVFLRVQGKVEFVHLNRTLTNFAMGGASTRNVLANCAEVRRALRKNGWSPLAAWSLYAIEVSRSLPGHLRRTLQRH
jgi:glycosyltransferase